MLHALQTLALAVVHHINGLTVQTSPALHPHPTGSTGETLLGDLAVSLPFVVGAVFFWWKRKTSVLQDDDALEPVDQDLYADQDRLPSDGERTERLATLKTRDPDFDPDVLAARVKKIFVAVQEALTRGEVKSVRALMSDAAYQRLTTRLSLASVFGTRPAIADIEISDVRISALEIASHYDAVHMGISYRARRIDVPSTLSPEEAHQTAHDAFRGQGAEVWSFLRRRGTHTTAEGVIEGRCPNCGAAFVGGESGKCDYCRATVNSGAFDWVLAKVSELADFWVTGQVAPGLSELVAHDPDCAAELLEDRAILLFWRYIDAMAIEDPSRVRKVALPDVVDGLEHRIERDRGDALREWYRNVKLAGADLMAVDRDVRGTDYAHVRVHWRHKRAVADRKEPPAARWTDKTSIVVMGRRSGASTDKESGVLTYRCWNCHAPLSDSDSTACDYCRADQIDNGNQWRLVAFQSFELWVARRRGPRATEREGVRGTVPISLHELTLPSERRRLFQMAVAVAASDRVISPAERGVLRARAMTLGLRDDEVSECLGAPPLAARDLPTPEEAGPFLEVLAEMAVADGEVSEAERMLLLRLARTLDVSPDDVQRALLDARRKRDRATAVNRATG